MVFITILAEVSLEKTGKGLTMSCLVTCHLMNGIMDRIEVQLLRTLRKVYLTSRCAVLCSDTYGEVLLRGWGRALA